MLFRHNLFQFKSLTCLSKSHFGGHANKVTTVLETKHNPQRLKQLRGHEQAELHMSQYEKEFYYIHKKTRKTFSLYNVFANLPSFITNNLANLASDQKVNIASDQIYLPRLSENSVPVYQSLSDFPVNLRMINKVTLALPLFTLATAHMPFIAFTVLGLHYFLYFKSSYALATERLVIKAQLLPQTEQLVFQKINRAGGIKTIRVRTNDIEAVNPDVDVDKYKRDLVFERTMRSVLNLDMIYRVKSTGEILMFQREGAWHEEGLYHELMP